MLYCTFPASDIKSRCGYHGHDTTRCSLEPPVEQAPRSDVLLQGEGTDGVVLQFKTAMQTLLCIAELAVQTQPSPFKQDLAPTALSQGWARARKTSPI